MGKKRDTANLEREIRAKEAFRLYSNRMTYIAIGRRLGITSPTVKRDVNWYMENKATPEEKAHIDRRTNADIQREERQESKRKKDEERDRWIRSVIRKLMEGRTIKEVAAEEGKSVPTIYKVISNYEKVDPNLVAEYRRVAKSHQFGRFDDPDEA